MKIKRIIISIAVFLFIAASLCIMANFKSPKIYEWYLNRKIGETKRLIEDRPIFYIIPEEELNNIVDRRYLNTLKKHTLRKIQLFLPGDFMIAKEKDRIISFKRAKDELLTGIVMVSYHEPGFFIQGKLLDVEMKEKLEKICIKDDFDFFTKVIYARKDEANNPLDIAFLTVKKIIFPRLGNEENLKIYKYTSSNQRGYITTNITESESNYSCDIFDEEGNYFNILIRVKDETLTLERVCTIISTVKRLSK